MPRFEKGSKQAKEWAQKMRKARESKKGMKGGYLQPGEMPPAAGPDPTNDVPEYIREPDGKDVSISGDGMTCKCCKVCGGKLKMKDLTKGLAKAGRALNPMAYAIKNKGTRDLMIQSGKLTNENLLPAVTTAGLPLYYGAAGTTGLLLGGPLGAMASTKGADMLWQEMVAKKGADPRARQKDKMLGAISGEIGKLGASQLKAGMSAPKSSGNGMVGGSLSPIEIAIITALSITLGIPATCVLAKLGADGLEALVERMRRNDQVAPDDVEAQPQRRQEMLRHNNQVIPFPQGLEQDFMSETATATASDSGSEPIDIEMGGVGMRRKKKKLIILKD
jgi:hypothetical protein